MPHSFSYAVSMNLEHSIKEESHEGYLDHLQCFRNIKKIKYPDFQAMTDGLIYPHLIEQSRLKAGTIWTTKGNVNNLADLRKALSTGLSIGAN